MKRLLLIALLSCISLATASGQLAAQDDSGIVKLVVPYVPGGFPDTMGRLIAAQLTSAGKQTFVVENRPGGAGVIAAEVVAKSAPDGRTLLVADAQQWAIAPQLLKSVTYDIQRDFAPISLVATTGNFLAVNSTMPVTSLEQFITLIKAKPDAYNYGIPGVGSLHHLIFEVFLQRTGAKLTQVPFKGGGEVAVALTTGQVQAAVQALPSIAARVKEGKVRILGIVTAKRSPLAPDVPTLQELGVPGMDFPGSLGILAPARTPPEIVNRLAAALKEAVHAPAVTGKMTSLTVEPLGTSPEEFAKYIRAEYARFGDAARSANLRKE